jgi:hypothetical protein
VANLLLLDGTTFFISQENGDGAVGRNPFKLTRFG